MKSPVFFKTCAWWANCFFAFTCAILSAVYINGCTSDPVVEEDEESVVAKFLSATPASGGELMVAATITIVFDNDPGTMKVSSGKVSVTDNTATITGPFRIVKNRLSLEIIWANGKDGAAESQLLDYTIVYGDPPEGMVLIPAGEFEMGSNDEEALPNEQPVHTVYVDAFYMDIYEVTNAEYKAFLDATNWESDRIPSGLFHGRHLAHWGGQPPDGGLANLPVCWVNWYDAMAYAEWAGKRLPTEAEWEKAARGGLVGEKYPWGNTPPNGTQCNFADKRLEPWAARNAIGDWWDKEADDGYIYWAPVGSYPPNGYGLYDMGGNVQEWCLDVYDENYYSVSPRVNPLSGTNRIELLRKNFTSAETDTERVIPRCQLGEWCRTCA